MEDTYQPITFKNAYKFLLFIFIAFTIYFCMRYLFLAFQITENHWIRFDKQYHTYFTLSIFLNIYPLLTGLILKKETHKDNGENVVFKFNEESRKFGGSVTNFSIIIYLLLFVSFVVRMIEN